MDNGSTKDLAYSYHGQKYIAFKYTRDMEERMKYKILENLKDGFMFSAKYEYTMKMFQLARVVCMAKFLPDESKMSDDRCK